MARGKQSIWIEERGNTLTCRKADLLKIKKAAIALFRAYEKLEAQQDAFDRQMRAFSYVIGPITIPKRELLGPRGR